MKKNYLTVHFLQAMIIISAILFSHPAICQDLTDAQRQERCQNNKNRIAELETQLKVINADLSKSMTNKEMTSQREQLAFVKKTKTVFTKSPYSSSWDSRKISKISAYYNFNMDECLVRIRNKTDFISAVDCLKELEKIIASKIDKANSLNQPALLAKKNEIEKQIRNHRNNLIALGCGANKGNSKVCNSDENALFAKMSGNWKSSIMLLSIQGSCDKVTGTYTIIEWCDGLDWESSKNGLNTRVVGTFSGTMSGVSLNVHYITPAFRKHNADEGDGSCQIQSDGSLKCKLPCSSQNLKR